MRNNDSKHPVAFRDSEAGLTLLELLVTVAVLAIIAFIGVPSFNSLVSSYRLSTVEDGLTAAHNMARFEAIKAGETIGVCGVQNSSSTSCVSDGNWSSGWMVYEVSGSGKSPLRYWSGEDSISVSAGADSEFTAEGVLLSEGHTIEVDQAGVKSCFELLLVGKVIKSSGACL